MNLFNAINKYRRANWCYKHNLRFLARFFEMRIYQAHNCFVPSCCELGEGTVLATRALVLSLARRFQLARTV